MPLSAAPEWLLELVRGGHKARERAGAEPVVDLDTEPAIYAAVEYLKNGAPESIEGAGGNDTLYRVLCHLKDLGIGQEMSVTLVEAHYNDTKAHPPWSPEEIETIAANAYAYGTSAPGSKSALAEFTAVDLEDRPGPTILFARPAEYPEDASPPPREYVVSPLIPQFKTTLLTGDGGVGKSLLAQQINTAVATGGDLFGLKTRQGTVLAIFSEDDEAELWRRQIDINRTTDKRMADLGPVNWWSADHVSEGCVLMSFTRDNPEGRLTAFFRKLDEAIGQLKPALVTLDPLANMFGGNEIDRAQVTGFVNRALNRLCVKHKTTVLGLAHPSVAGMLEGSGRSGSTGWANAVRSRLYLSRPKNDVSGDYRVLKTTKANYGKFGGEILLKWSQGAFVSAVNADADPAFTCDGALFEALRVLHDRGDLLSTGTRAGNYAIKLAMALPEVNGLDRPTLEAALERLIRSGDVVVEERLNEYRKPIRVVVPITHQD